MKKIWTCAISDHEHSTEAQAAECTAIFKERFLHAMSHPPLRKEAVRLWLDIESPS